MGLTGCIIMAVDQFVSAIFLCIKGDLSVCGELGDFVQRLCTFRLGQQTSDSLEFLSGCAECRLNQGGDVFEYR